MFKHIAAKVFSMIIVGTPTPQNETTKVGYYYPNFGIDLSLYQENNRRLLQIIRYKQACRRRKYKWGLRMNIIVTCYNCKHDFFATIGINQHVKRCPNCFKSNRVRTIIDGKALGEYNCSAAKFESCYEHNVVFK